MVGDRLKRLREAMQFTQDELAHELGVPKLKIWRHENDKVDVPDSSVVQYANFFNVSADYLLGITNDPSPTRAIDLSPRELLAIRAWREADKLKAIQVIVGDD